MLKRISFVVWVCLLTATAEAANFYVGGGWGVDVDVSSLDLNSGGVETLETTGDSYKLFLGVGLSQHLAVEGSYYDFGGHRCCREILDSGFDVRSDGYSVAAVGSLQVGRVQLLAKLGALRWQEDGKFISIAGESDFSDSGTTLVLGAGVAIPLVRGFELRAEWERFELADRSGDGIWGTVLYRF